MSQPASGRAFGLTFTVVFAVIGLLTLRSGAEPRWWALGVAAALLVLALAFPRLLVLPARGWAAFARLIGRVTNPIVLALIWVVVFTPFGLIARLIRRRPIDLAIRRDAPTYWIRRSDDDHGTMRDPY